MRKPVYARSLISAFVVRCLDSIIPLLAISEISSLYLISVAEQAGLSLTLSQLPKTGFLAPGLNSGGHLLGCLSVVGVPFPFDVLARCGVPLNIWNSISFHRLSQHHFENTVHSYYSHIV